MTGMLEFIIERTEGGLGASWEQMAWNSGAYNSTWLKWLLMRRETQGEVFDRFEQKLAKMGRSDLPAIVNITVRPLVTKNMKRANTKTECLCQAQRLNVTALARVDELVREEKETFNQRKLQDKRWFGLRLSMGYAAIPFLVGVAIFCGYILLNWSLFPENVVVSAEATLFVDVLGVIASIWKAVLGSDSCAKLQPVTSLPCLTNAQAPSRESRKTKGQLTKES